MASGDPYPNLYPFPKAFDPEAGGAPRDPGARGYYAVGPAYDRAVRQWEAIHLFVNVILPYGLGLLILVWPTERQRARVRRWVARAGSSLAS